MSTFRLSHLSKPTILKRIAPANLLKLLEPHQDFFAKCGLELPRSNHPDSLDYQALAAILISPSHKMPAGLAEALFTIDEMATEEQTDRNPA